MYFWEWSSFFSRLFLIKLFPWGVPYPPSIEIEPTTRCNLKCTICEHTYWNEKGRNMSFVEFKNIVDQFPKLRWTGLTGIGSSFLNKDFLRMVEYLKKRSIIVELIDTFNHIDEKIVEKIVDMEVDFYYISMYGATKQTYESVCLGSNFDKIMNNIKYLVKLKQKKKTLLPIVNFHFIVSQTNYHEMLPFLELVHSLDVDEFQVLFTPLLHPFKEIKHLAVDIPKERRAEVAQKAKELGISVIYNNCAQLKKPPIKECTAWLEPFIFATGHVVPCCAGNEANRREFQKRTSLGNAFEKDFLEIWNSHEYKELTEKIHNGEIPVQCANCTIFDTKSKWEEPT
ncbi:MAG: radical SAM/SPASM domain-containing protein [bacterium]